jgi:hypothetical protein
MDQSRGPPSQAACQPGLPGLRKLSGRGFAHECPQFDRPNDQFELCRLPFAAVARYVFGEDVDGEIERIIDACRG